MYKKFFIKTIIIVFIMSLFPILLAYSLSDKHVWKSESPAIIITKHKEISDKIDSPKMLIIGGSSTLLGVNTERMSKELNYPIINLGSTVALRLDYILYDAKRNIQNNDIVILPLEYAIYYEDELSEEKLVQIWQNDKQYFNELPVVAKIKLLWNVPFYLECKVLGTYLGISTTRENRTELVYTTVNKNGDSINTLETEEKKLSIENPFFRNKYYLDNDIKNTIIDFLNYCKEKNVKVFVTYPPYYYNQKYFDGYNLKQINKINDFWKEQDVTILGQYTDFIYTDKNDFYDSQYHLNIKGREKRTEQLIKLLKPYINNN